MPPRKPGDAEDILYSTPVGGTAAGSARLSSPGRSLFLDDVQPQQQPNQVTASETPGNVVVNGTEMPANDPRIATDPDVSQRVNRLVQSGAVSGSSGSSSGGPTSSNSTEDINVTTNSNNVENSVSNTQTDQRVNSFNNIQSNSNLVQNRTATSNTQRDSVTNRNNNINVTGSERKYIDIPTPEEFLDEFQNSFSTYVKRNAGALGLNESQWLMENMDLFMGDYLAKLGEMADRGEQVFKATPVSDQNTYLGSRAGDTSSVNTRGTTTENERGTATSQGTSQQTGVRTGSETQVGGQTTQQNQVVNSTQNQQNQQNQQTNTNASGSTVNSQGQVQSGNESTAQNRTAITNSQTVGNEQNNSVTNRGSNTTEQTNEQTNSILNSNERENFNNNSILNSNQNVNTAMTEDIYSRPKVGVVHSLSPLDFLSQTFTPQNLRVIYQGRVGMRYAEGRIGGATVGAKAVN